MPRRSGCEFHGSVHSQQGGSAGSAWRHLQPSSLSLLGGILPCFPDSTQLGSSCRKPSLIAPPPTLVLFPLFPLHLAYLRAALIFGHLLASITGLQATGGQGLKIPEWMWMRNRGAEGERGFLPKVAFGTTLGEEQDFYNSGGEASRAQLPQRHVVGYGRGALSDQADGPVDRGP